jgi:hypothetical protein
MPACSKCGERYSAGHFSRHTVDSDQHRAFHLARTVTIKSCSRCGLAYAAGDYESHRRDLGHVAVVSRRSQVLPLCNVCGERYQAGQYRLHRMTPAHIYFQATGKPLPWA